MGDWISAMLATVAPRLVAAVASVVVAKAVANGIPMDQATVTGVMLGAYAMIHKAISSRVNPGDAAKGRVAAAEKQAAQYGGNVMVQPDSSK